MNQKQRARKLERRRKSRFAISPATLAYKEVQAQAERLGKGESYVLTQMQQRGYLPTASGWRAMTDKEKEIWRQ